MTSDTSGLDYPFNSVLLLYCTYLFTDWLCPLGYFRQDLQLLQPSQEFHLLGDPSTKKPGSHVHMFTTHVETIVITALADLEGACPAHAPQGS